MPAVTGPGTQSPRPTGFRFGGWEVVSLLGRGATGAVYECANVHAPELRAAVKELRPGGDKERLRREAVLLAALDHPGVVRVRDLVIEEQVWLVMDLVRGAPFSGSVPLAPDAAMACCRRLAEAVAHLHAAGVAHRDLKPSNVLVADGRPVIVDFGLGSAVEGAEAAAARPGTLAYTAPELLDDRIGEVRPDRADIYALGLLYAEIWTGRAPEAPASGPGLAAWVRTRRRAPEVDPGEGVPAEVRSLVLAMTARSPAQRPSAAEVVAALPPVESAAAVVAPVNPARRSRRRLWASGALLLPAAAAVALLMPGAGKPSCRPTAEVLGDGIDQDCDGVDRRAAMLARRGDGLVFSAAGSDISAPLPLDARLVASVEGPWVAEPVEGGTRLRRVRDDLTLGHALDVPASGHPADAAEPGRVLLVDPVLGVVHRVDLATGEVLETVGAAGVDHALGRAGAPDLWVTRCEAASCRIGRHNWIGQPVGDHALPGPAEALVAAGSAVVAVGAWGAAVLGEEGPPVVVPPPAGLGAPTVAFAEPGGGAIWVGDGVRFAHLEPATRAYSLPATNALAGVAPWFPPETVDLVPTPDADGDGWPAAAWRSADCADTDPARHPGATDADGDGVDQDCSGADGPPGEASGAGVTRTVWSVRNALDWTPIDLPFTVTLGGETTRGAPGARVERAVPPGVTWARIEVEGYVPVVRPLGHGVPSTVHDVLLLPAWTALAGGPRYGEWRRPGAPGLTTVAMQRDDPAANYPGVRFDLQGSDRGTYLAGGEPEGGDVRVQPQYGWIFWRGVEAGPHRVDVTPPEGTRCWLPGDLEPVDGPVSVVLLPDALTYLLVGCEEVPS